MRSTHDSDVRPVHAAVLVWYVLNTLDAISIDGARSKWLSVDDVRRLARCELPINIGTRAQHLHIAVLHQQARFHLTVSAVLLALRSHTVLTAPVVVVVLVTCTTERHEVELVVKVLDLQLIVHRRNLLIDQVLGLVKHM